MLEIIFNIQTVFLSVLSYLLVWLMNLFLFQQGRPGCGETEAHAILDRFVELGGNFIDTADMYQNGLSESIIGNWLEKYVV